MKSEAKKRNCILWVGSSLGRLVVSLFEIHNDGIYEKEINGERYKILKKRNVINIELIPVVSNESKGINNEQ